MDESLNEQRLQVLREFAQAWNRHDLSALMAAMADDCAFYSAAGERDRGGVFVGRDAVATAYASIFKTFPDAAWNDDTHLVIGDRGVSEWRFTATNADGSPVEVFGCDLFEFRGDRICVKDSYRKQRT